MRQGFTLIELLVVMAIIAMIASFSFIQFEGYRARVRDVERETTMKELQKSLALYIAEKRAFPQETRITITGADPFSRELIDAGVIQAIKPDPRSSGDYVYKYDSSSGATYTITYWLETDSIPGKSKGRPQSVSP